MHDVFICYYSTSLDIAARIADYLENFGIKCWYAPRDVIDSYPDEIPIAISN